MLRKRGLLHQHSRIWADWAAACEACIRCYHEPGRQLTTDKCSSRRDWVVAISSAFLVRHHIPTSKAGCTCVFEAGRIKPAPWRLGRKLSGWDLMVTCRRSCTVSDTSDSSLLLLVLLQPLVGEDLCVACSMQRPTCLNISLTGELKRSK